MTGSFLPASSARVPRPAVREPAPDVPGMETAVAVGSSAVVARVTRVGLNAWLLVMLDEGALPLADALEHAVHEVLDPAVLLARLDEGARLRGLVGTALLGLLELDRCGAWLTLACAGHPLPLVVRRAGWVDARAQLGPSLGMAGPEPVGIDRVGLGPGDALVVSSSALALAADGGGERFADEHLPEALLAAATSPAAGIATAVTTAVREHAGAVPSRTSVLVVRVPDDALDDPEGRLAQAIGDPDQAPGYPVGVPHWAPEDRPRPPRAARTLLPGDATAAGAARRFLNGVLHNWRLSPLVDGDLDLIISELVGNAVRHAEGARAVLIDYDGRRVRVAVGDGSRALPEQRPASREATSGRGIAIVDALADAHGTVATVTGKRVWAELRVPPALTSR